MKAALVIMAMEIVDGEGGHVLVDAAGSWSSYVWQSSFGRDERTSG